MDDDEFDSILARSMKSRPVPPPIEELAQRGMKTARAAASEQLERLQALNRRMAVANALAAGIIVAVVGLALWKISTPSTPFPPSAVVLEQADDAAASVPLPDEAALALICAFLTCGAIVFSAVERVMRRPVPASWGLEPRAA